MHCMVIALAYYREMDIRSRRESYKKWCSGETKVMVATCAFGMGIINQTFGTLIRYGAPENIIIQLGTRVW